MKNMVLLIDANVVLDYLLHREPNFSYAKKLLRNCQSDDIDGYIAFHSMSIIWYALRKHPIAERRQALRMIATMLTVVGASHSAVLEAIESNEFSDFEDCLQEKCAENVSADYIVTENVKDYSASPIPAVASAEIVEMLEGRE